MFALAGFLCPPAQPPPPVCARVSAAAAEQVRHQFNTIPGLMEGTARPDYRRCVEISTQVSNGSY